MEPSREGCDEEPAGSNRNTRDDAIGIADIRSVMGGDR